MQSSYEVLIEQWRSGLQGTARVNGSSAGFTCEADPILSYPSLSVTSTRHLSRHLFEDPAERQLASKEHAGKELNLTTKTTLIIPENVW